MSAEPPAGEPSATNTGATRRAFLVSSGTAVAALVGTSSVAQVEDDGPTGKRSETGSDRDIPGRVPVTLRINGKSHALKLDPRTTLLDCLREVVDLTGTKKGCDHGQCGAC